MSEDRLRNELDKATLRWEKWAYIYYQGTYEHHGKTREEARVIMNYFEGKVDAYTEVLRGEI